MDAYGFVGGVCGYGYGTAPAKLGGGGRKGGIGGIDALVGWVVEGDA